MSANELLARAFHNDPLFCWAESNPSRRLRMSSQVFKAQLKHASQHGGYLHEPGVGVVDWREKTSAHMGGVDILMTGMWKVGLCSLPKTWIGLAKHEAYSMRHVQTFLEDDSVYLSTLGVEPTVAGKGYGTMLLQRALAEQSKKWRRCVLRTEQPQNVPFYSKHGFALVDELIVPVSRLPVWVFSRSLDG